MKKSAFTLIELIIVLGIISIGSAIAILRFNVVDKIGARNEIQTFVDDYSYLRDLALSNGKTNTLSFDENGYTMTGYIKKERKLKYIKSLHKDKISFTNDAYVSADKTTEAYNLDFVSRKDPNTKWNFTIQAVGGYLNEK